MAKQRYAGIMAGGSGERFWPLSRYRLPKQLLKLPGQSRTLLGETLERVQGVIPDSNVFVLTDEHLAQSVLLAEPQIESSNLLIEPLKRNTAGCLCWLAANLLAMRVEPSETTLAILPADHRISPVDAYRQTIEQALKIAETTGAIVTIGLRPTRPETGYGYIESDIERSTGTSGQYPAFSVRKFHEKPDVSKAREYAGNPAFLWNSGMIFWRLDTFLSEIQRVSSLHYSVIQRLTPLIQARDVLEAERVFAELPDISIDFLLLEHALSVSVIVPPFEWDDVGSWDALSRYLDTDVHGNATIGDSVIVQSDGCIVHNESQNVTVCLSGVENLLVVATDDAILVCDKTRVQTVRDIVARLKERNSRKL